jgi:hypothetical protein
VGKGLPLVWPLEYIDVGPGQLVLDAKVNCLDDDYIKECFFSEMIVELGMINQKQTNHD